MTASKAFVLVTRVYRFVLKDEHESEHVSTSSLQQSFRHTARIGAKLLWIYGEVVFDLRGPGCRPCGPFGLLSLSP